MNAWPRPLSEFCSTTSLGLRTFLSRRISPSLPRAFPERAQNPLPPTPPNTRPWEKPSLVLDFSLLPPTFTFLVSAFLGAAFAFYIRSSFLRPFGFLGVLVFRDQQSRPRPPFSAGMLSLPFALRFSLFLITSSSIVPSSGVLKFAVQVFLGIFFLRIFFFGPPWCHLIPIAKAEEAAFVSPICKVFVFPTLSFLSLCWRFCDLKISTPPKLFL